MNSSTRLRYTSSGWERCVWQPQKTGVGVGWGHCTRGRHRGMRCMHKERKKKKQDRSSFLASLHRRPQTGPGATTPPPHHTRTQRPHLVACCVEAVLQFHNIWVAQLLHDLQLPVLWWGTCGNKHLSVKKFERWSRGRSRTKQRRATWTGPP